MSDMPSIIRFLDSELERLGRTFFTPIEANTILKEAGLLTQAPSDPGLSIRKLLSAGKIPYAYQVGGPRGHWVIPHSSARRTLDKPYTDYSKDNPPHGMGGASASSA